MTAPPSSKPTQPIPLTVNTLSPTDTSSLTRFINIISTAFLTSPLSIAFRTERYNTPPPYPSPQITTALLTEHFTPHITSAATNGAILLEAGDFSAVALWETPSFRGQPFTQNVTDGAPIRGYWVRRVEELKREYLGTRTEDGKEVLNPHYHLGFLARNPEKLKVEGAISAVVRPMLEECVRVGVPGWLEATGERAVRIYEHWGFRVVEVVRVGVGVRDERGWPEEGGVGCRGWVMIFDGHLRGKSAGVVVHGDASGNVEGE